MEIHFGEYSPPFRRQASRPSAFRILPCEQASSPALARHLVPLSLHSAFRGPDDVAEHLPANGVVAVEEPASYFVGGAGQGQNP